MGTLCIGIVALMGALFNWRNRLDRRAHLRLSSIISVGENCFHPQRAVHGCLTFWSLRRDKVRPSSQYLTEPRHFCAAYCHGKECIYPAALFLACLVPGRVVVLKNASLRCAFFMLFCDRQLCFALASDTICSRFGLSKRRRPSLFFYSMDGADVLRRLSCCPENHVFFTLMTLWESHSAGATAFRYVATVIGAWFSAHELNCSSIDALLRVLSTVLILSE